MKFTLVLLLGGLAAMAEAPVGKQFESIEVLDNGKPKTIKLTGGKATAIVFVGANCAASDAYGPRLDVLDLDYDTKGVKFIFLNANADEDAAALEQYARKMSWKRIQIYKDPGGRVATMLSAKKTPEIFLFDKGGTVVYRGRIDDSEREAAVTKRYVRNAIDATLDTRSVEEPEVPVEDGCPIRIQANGGR